ncbi:MAG TPA: LysE family translocator [Steroidobacteraceae bacterium]|nr:LysE family translocator [Steroidobacteraceae bacterium]
MHHFLPAWPLLATFIGASVVLAVTPGPGVIYIVTRSLSQGRSAGFASVGGIAVGNIMNAAAASLGLAAVLATSALLYAALKYLGAAYLFYLAFQMLRRNEAPASAATLQPVQPRKVFRDGVIVAILNPKTALFYAALLPQFIDSPQHFTRQALLLSAIFVAIAAVSDSTYVMLSRGIAAKFSANARGLKAGRYAAAAMYAGLGVLAATTNHPGAHKSGR